MTTIAILGSGNVARDLMGKLLEAGHEIVLGSRDPQNSAAAEWAGKANGSLTDHAFPRRSRHCMAARSLVSGDAQEQERSTKPTEGSMET